MMRASFPLVGEHCQLRPWALSDLDALVRHAHNRNVSKQMRDLFPYPYTHADGLAFLTLVTADAIPTALAVVVEGAVCGGVGLALRSGNERRSVEVGYWLGESYWGRGCGTDALRLVTGYAVNVFDVARVEAHAMATNTRSCRILERAGYVLEGRARRSFLKDGVLHDRCCYAWVTP